MSLLIANKNVLTSKMSNIFLFLQVVESDEEYLFLNLGEVMHLHTFCLLTERVIIVLKQPKFIILIFFMKINLFKISPDEVEIT